VNRISITYPATPGASFDWDYYMNRHLPLAVGTSMRHSGLNYCDADRPVSADPPHVCVCLVHFDSAQTMRDFCVFFAEGHPESQKIGEDEKNYTSIEPGMTAGECIRRELLGEAPAVTWRTRMFFPWSDTAEESREKISAVLMAILERENAVAAGAVATELDYCTSGLVPGSPPQYSFIWTIGFSGREVAETFMPELFSGDTMAVLHELFHVSPRTMISEVMPFDMQLTAPYRQA